jgi:AcrR family transcriptional regulator
MRKNWNCLAPRHNNQPAARSDPLRTSSDRPTAKERILRASTEMFAQYGYSGTSTREIARRAKVNEASIYRYFARKRDLFTAALERELDQYCARPDCLSLASRENPQDTIGLTFQRIADIVTHQPGLIRMLQFSALEFGLGMRPLYRKHLGQVIGATARDLKRWSKQQARPRFHSEVTLLSFVATVVLVQNFYQLFARTPITPAAAKKVTATCVEVWCSLLSHRGPTYPAAAATAGLRSDGS